MECEQSIRNAISVSIDIICHMKIFKPKSFSDNYGITLPLVRLAGA